MTNTIYDLAEEPKGDVYRKLIQHSLGYCDSFQFVIRPTVDINESCKQLLNNLKPFLRGRTEESQWPGTQLVNGTAEIYRYNLTQASVIILAEVTDSLYAWLQPNLPEDLCFLRFEGKPWLVTITHEADGYLDLSTEERNLLAKKLPELVLKKNETYH